MICQRCLYRAAAHTSFAKSPIPATHFPQFNGRAAQHTTQRFCRTFTSKPPASQQAVSPAASTQAKGRQPGGPPSATSTSAAQPFSTPFTPSAPPLAANASKPSPIPASSVPAGTPLRGLNYLKNHSEPLALEDSEYPAWLWKCLDGVGEKGKTDGGDGEGEGDLFSKSKKQRRIAAKKMRKQAVLHPESLAPKIPIQEQSIDLPAGDGTVRGALEALGAREEITRAMRDKRRSKIKEANFLKGMR